MLLFCEDTIVCDKKILVVVWVDHEKLKSVWPEHTDTRWHPLFVGVLFLHKSGKLCLVRLRRYTRH